MLDRSVVSDPAMRTGWVLSLCPAAAEAGGCFVAARRAVRSGGGVPNPERARAEAARRARGRLRRYCAANGLNRLGTLTYRGAGCHDPAQVRADLGVFFGSLREAIGGHVFPYVWVPEWHPGGHGLHAHFAVGMFIKQAVIRDAWGHGIVSIKLLSDLPVGSGRLEESRKAAGYLSKYVAKSFRISGCRGGGIAMTWRMGSSRSGCRCGVGRRRRSSARRRRCLLGWRGAQVVLLRPRGSAGASGAVGAAVNRREVLPAQVAALVERTCAEQGVPVHVVDRATV